MCKKEQTCSRVVPRVFGGNRPHQKGWSVGGRNLYLGSIFVWFQPLDHIVCYSVIFGETNEKLNYVH